MLNKKKMSKVLFTSFMSLSVLLAGCGAQENSSQSDNNNSESQEAKSNSGLKGDLQYWSSYSETEPQAEVLKAAAESFMEENPEVNIEFTFNGRDNSKLLPTAIQGGQEIDMYDANGVNIINKFSTSNRVLSHYFEKDYPTTDGTPYKEYTLQSMVSLAENLGEGDLYYVPMNPQAFVFMYNKDIFEKAGIKSVPTTWDEFLEAGQKIKDAGYTPLTTDPNYSTGIFGYYLSRLKGEDWVAQLANDSTYEMWNDPAVLEAAKALEELAHRGFYADNVATVQFPQAQQEFVLQEKIAMYLNGTWMPAEVQLTAREDFPWGQFAFPEVEGGMDSTTATAYSSYGIGVNKESSEEEAEAAFNFAVYVNTGEFDQMMVDVANAIPVGKEASYPSALKGTKEILENTTSRYNSQTSIATNSDNSQIIRSAVINLISGKTTAEEFIAEIQNAGK